MNQKIVPRSESATAEVQVQLASIDSRLASDGTGAGSLAVRVKCPSTVTDYR